MDFNYISGFFDADGSISLLSIHKNEHKTVQIAFCNNELNILIAIQSFIYLKIQVKGFISKKKARKNNHADNYELKYVRNGAIKLVSHLNSHHPKKKFRIKIILCYYKKVTKRNGKYCERALARKMAFNRLFYWKTI